MTEQIRILSAEDYMQKYGADGIGKGADRWMIRRQMLDAMRKEIFDLAVFRIGPQVFNDEYQPSEKEQQKLINILINAEKKWGKICRIFGMYKETCDLIQPKDLREYLDEDLSEIRKSVTDDISAEKENETDEEAEEKGE